LREFRGSLGTRRQSRHELCSANGKVLCFLRRFYAASLLRAWVLVALAAEPTSCRNRGREYRLSSVPPPSEPYGRFSRIRLSG
jgi:hypothetical protein